MNMAAAPCAGGSGNSFKSPFNPKPKKTTPSTRRAVFIALDSIGLPTRRVQLVRSVWSELSADGAFVHFPRRCARFARRDHLVKIDVDVQARRQVLQLLCNGPVVVKIVDVQLHDVAFGIVIIHCRLNELVGGPQERNAERFEPKICAQQIVERFVFEGDVLHPCVTIPVAIAREAGCLKERETMVYLVVGSEGHGLERRAGGRIHASMDNDPEHLAVPVEHGVQVAGRQSAMLKFRMDGDFRIHRFLLFVSRLRGQKCDCGSHGSAGANSPATARVCKSQGSAPAFRAATSLSGSIWEGIPGRADFMYSVAVKGLP